MSCLYTADGYSICCAERKMTDQTFGVWSTCDRCGHDWWTVASEWDYLDEPTAFVCSDGCPGDDYDDEGDEPW